MKHELFSPCDTLSAFSDYRFMNVDQQIEMAKELVKQALASGYRRILVVETGASPLQEIMELMSGEFSFFSLKVPRESQIEDFLKEASAESIAALSNFISEPFLILDEYIDSGLSMKKVLLLLNELHCSVSYKIISYMNFYHEDDINDLILYSHADDQTKYEHFKEGVYPFENRLDYIPHFYDESCCLVHLDQFLVDGAHPSFDQYIASLGANTDLLASIRDHLSGDLKEFVTKRHLICYSLYLLEKNPRAKRFYWLLFDMYGPCWTPLSKNYHLSYWEGFEVSSQIIQDSLENKERIHCFYSPYILHEAAQTMLKRHDEWKKELTRRLK